ncbi:MAG: hypothetical protein FWD68_07445 [Alphaproteobacteria bacterium]|nr:hypothetical protein [Alphaproteobacteria bacterium]
MYVVYPACLNRWSIFHLDDEDFSLVMRYIESVPNVSGNEMLTSVVGGGELVPNHPFLADRDKAKGRLNDRLFLKKMERRTELICPDCVQGKV